MPDHFDSDKRIIDATVRENTDKELIRFYTLSFRFAQAGYDTDHPYHRR